MSEYVVGFCEGRNTSVANHVVIHDVRSDDLLLLRDERILNKVSTADVASGACNKLGERYAVELIANVLVCVVGYVQHESCVGGQIFKGELAEGICFSREGFRENVDVARVDVRQAQRKA